MQSLKGVDLALMALGSPTATDLYSRGSIVADLNYFKLRLMKTDKRWRQPNGVKEPESWKRTALGLQNQALSLTSSHGNTAGLSELVSSSLPEEQPRARFGRGGLLNTEMRLRGASSLLSRTL